MREKKSNLDDFLCKLSKLHRMKIVARNIKYVWQVIYFFLQALFPLLVLPVLITFSISVKSLGFILLSRNQRDLCARSWELVVFSLTSQTYAHSCALELAREC